MNGNSKLYFVEYLDFTHFNNVETFLRAELFLGPAKALTLPRT